MSTFSRRLKKLAAIGAPIGLAVALLTGVPSQAATQCYGTDMCYWDNGSLSGATLGTVVGDPGTGTFSVNVADNVISSGRSQAPVRYNPANGAQRKWYGLNQDNIVTSTIVATFNRNTNVYLSGTSANNVIDDLLWR